MSARLWSNLQQPRRSANTTAATTTGRAPATEDLEEIGRQRGLVAKPLTAKNVQAMDAVTLLWHERWNKANLEAALESANPQKQQTDSVSDESTLTYEQIQRMSADEARTVMLRDPNGWKAAFAKEETRRASRQHMKDSDTKRQWSGRATQEEITKACETGAEFFAKFPQFLETPANIQAMLNWMKDNDLSCTDLSSYVSAFRALSRDGRLEQGKVESALQYRANHPELEDTRKPPLIAVREAKQRNTDKLQEETAKATAASGSTRFTDYAPEQRGPLYAHVDKQSFRALLRNRSTDEYQARLADPLFRAAVDGINSEK